MNQNKMLREIIVDETMMASSGAEIREQTAQEVKSGQELIMLKMPERVKALNDLVHRLMNTRLTYPSDDGQGEPKEEDALNLFKSASLPAALKKLSITESRKDGEQQQQQELQGDVSLSESSNSSHDAENISKGAKNRPAPANERLIELENELLLILRQQIIDLEQIRLMILLLNAPIECGNNFGTGVQIKVLQYLSSYTQVAMDNLKGMGWMDRANIVTKIQKYPEVDDFKYHLLTYDQKLLAKLLQKALTSVSARNGYMVVHDILIKNWNRITDPKDTQGKSSKSSTGSSYIS